MIEPEKICDTIDALLKTYFSNQEVGKYATATRVSSVLNGIDQNSNDQHWVQIKYNITVFNLEAKENEGIIQ
jgi:hypothetical protein